MRKEEELTLKEIRMQNKTKNRIKNRQRQKEEITKADKETPTIKKNQRKKDPSVPKVTISKAPDTVSKKSSPKKTAKKKDNNQKKKNSPDNKKQNLTEKNKETVNAKKDQFESGKEKTVEKVIEVKTTPKKESVIKVYKDKALLKIEELKKKREYKKIQEGRKKDEPEDQKRPKGSKKVFAATVVVMSIVGIMALCGIVALVIAFKMLQGMPDLDLADLKAPESSVIYDANVEVVAELGEYKRENIAYEDMPNSLVDAFLAIEDSRFFEHNGFDIPRFTKAFLENIKTMSFSQGGSTFDMQLIKNTYFQVDDGENSTIAEKKISRKLQEIVLAMEADSKMDKRDIFASYLNRINFGNNIRGVQKASQYYFGKDVSELDLSESAFLAGIINSPNSCNPYNNLIKYDEDNIYVSASIDYLKNGTERRNEVLDMMVYHGYITETECEMAKAIKLEDQLVGESSVWDDTIPYYQSYIDAVIEEASELTGLDPTTNSMEIYTNMDPYMQQLVYDIQNTDKYIDWYRDEFQNAIVSMNNQTGAIVAIGGGRNQSGSLNWNRATMSKIQPGSTIKPVFEYLLAFEELGWATSHTLTDRPIYLYGSDHLIANASGTYDGDMLMTEAVARSLNTPAIQTLEAVIEAKGEQFCIDYLKSIGFEFAEDTFDLQYALGGNTLQVSPVELAGAHAILFNGGHYIEPHTISRIVLADGTEYVADTKGEQVVSEDAAYLAAQLEYEVVYGGFYNYTQILKDDYPVFAKTGTTDWGDSGVEYGIPIGSAKDSWLVCSTDQYTNVIWIGFDRADVGTYITASDDNVNIKGQIGNILLDSEVEHFDYEPGYLKRPDGVVSITHVRGVYPYVEPTVGTPVTGLIKKEFYHLGSASDIQYETRVGSLTDINATKIDDTTLQVDFNVLSDSSGDGMQDLTATSLSGKVTHAYGRLYFPRIRYVIPDGAVYYAEVLIDGTPVANSSSSSTSMTISVPQGLSTGQIEVCGSYNLSQDRFCKVIQ